MVELYAGCYDHGTTATTYINDNIVVCVLENILTSDEAALVTAGSRGEVIDGGWRFNRGRVHCGDRAVYSPSGGRVHERQPEHTGCRL
jgi:hypothetical protein